MLQRLIILTLLVGSTAIPMQNESNIRNRTVQNIELNKCELSHENFHIVGDMVRRIPEKQIRNQECNN